MRQKKVVTQAWITPAQIQDASIKLWGEKWREGFQTFFDMSYSQLHRYMAVYGGQTVPKSVALALDMALTIKANELDLPDLKPTPIADVKPLLFVPEKKPKVPRPNNDAPEIDLFADPEPVKTEEPETATEPSAPEPESAETAPEPDRTEPATEPKAKPVKKPASKPKAKPSTAKPKPKTPAKSTKK